jgi:hypothetical protein
MRLVLAALFVVGGMAAAVGLLGEAGAIDRAPWALGAGLAILMLALSVAALALFNPWWADPLRRMTPDDLLRRLEGEGLLASADFQARRAFGAREANDEGLHYFLELVDGRVLYLNGQYLYDYEPISDDPEVNRPRRFPCTDFTVRRHKAEGYVVGLVCRGTVMEPELMAPPLTGRARRSIGAPGDGQVLADRPYDLLKELLLGGAAEPGGVPDTGRESC